MNPCGPCIYYMYIYILYVYIYIYCDWIHTGSFSSHLSRSVATFFNGQLKSRLQQNGTCSQKGLEMESAPNQAKCRPRHVATVHSLWLQVAKIPTSTHLLACLSQKQLWNTGWFLFDSPEIWMASRGLWKVWKMTGITYTFTLPTENLIFTFCDVILICGLKPFHPGFCGSSFL